MCMSSCLRWSLNLWTRIIIFAGSWIILASKLLSIFGCNCVRCVTRGLFRFRHADVGESSDE